MRIRPAFRSLLVGSTLAALLLAASACSGRQPADMQITDASITAKVKSKIVADPSVNPFEIDVDTTDRVVRLSGTVETDEDRRRAAEIAMNTRGVTAVENEIELGDPTLGENIADDWILAKVKTKIAADPELNPFNIDVDVVRGVVTLSGAVESAADREEAERLARATRGVESVRNRIEVKS